MKKRMSIRRIGLICVAVLVSFIMICALFTWNTNQRPITEALKENSLTLDLTCLLELLQQMDDSAGHLLNALEHERDSIFQEFNAQYAQAMAYLEQVMDQVDGQRYYNALDISRMFESYSCEFYDFYEVILADETASVYLRGLRVDLKTLNSYIRDELGDAIADHLNYSKDAIECSLSGMKQTKNILLLFALMCALACVGMIQYLMHLICTPLSGLIDRIDRFRNTGRVEARASRGSMCSEMCLLAESFDSMAAEVAQKQENERMLARLEMNNMEMKYQLDKARLDMLQAQLNPHFLFNTLNAIYALTLQENAQHSGEMISYLSSILRYSLSSLSSFVEIYREKEILMDYIHILKLRFGDSIEFSFSVEPELEDAEIPIMMIQPLIENSVMHAFNQPDRKNRVDVTIRRSGENICVIVSDNGSGMSSELVRRIHTGEKSGSGDSHHGIGLDNVIKRMNILYGDGHVIIESASGVGTRITLVVAPISQREV